MDLVTRLLLNTTQFDNNIRNSTQQIQQFQNVGQSITGAIGKFAGVLGLSMGALEAFNRTMDATQTTGDAFEKITTQGSAAVDTFFNSLSRGDFSNFLSGLQNAISKAGELADVMDELQSKSLFNDVEINNLNTKKQLYQNKARDKTLSDAERNKYNNLAKQTDTKITARKQDLAGANNNAYYAGVRSLIAKGGYTGNVTNQMIDYLMTETNKSKINNAAGNYDKNTFTLGKNKAGTLFDKKAFVKANKDAEKYATESFGKLAKTFTDLQEEALKPFVELKKIANQQVTEISDATLDLHNTDAKINGSYKKQHSGSGKTKATKAEEVINKDSLDEVNKQLADARKKYDAVATTELRQQLFKVIEDLEARKIQLNFVAQYGNMKNVKTEMAGLGDATKDTDLSKFNKLPTNFSNPITKKGIKINNEYVESLNAIGTTMGAITNMANDGASAWLN